MRVTPRASLARMLWDRQDNSVSILAGRSGGMRGIARCARQTADAYHWPQRVPSGICTMMLAVRGIPRRARANLSIVNPSAISPPCGKCGFPEIVTVGCQPGQRSSCLCRGGVCLTEPEFLQSPAGHRDILSLAPPSVHQLSRFPSGRTPRLESAGRHIIPNRITSQRHDRRG